MNTRRGGCRRDLAPYRTPPHGTRVGPTDPGFFPDCQAPAPARLARQCPRPPPQLLSGSAARSSSSPVAPRRQLRVSRPTARGALVHGKMIMMMMIMMLMMVVAVVAAVVSAVVAVSLVVVVMAGMMT